MSESPEKQTGLPLWQALSWLIEDWRRMEGAGETPMRLRICEVFDQVYADGQASMGYHPRLKPEQVVDLVLMDLEEVGSLEFARRKARRFRSKEGLLKRTDLFDFLREL